MKTASRKVGLGLFLSSAAFLLSACGGGGGDAGSSPPPPPPSLGTLSVSARKVTFNAAGPYARAPATQTITGTVTGLTTSGILYIKVVANNPGGSFTVSSVTIAGNSGQADVIPAEPAALAAGSYQGSITVTACLNDSTCNTGQLSGSPQTIAVDYEIASGVDGDTVTPHVVAANASGEVILRGSGFTGATTVSFGGTAATAITVVSDSEIDADYPALPAGTYPVTIDSGSVSDTASLVVVAPPAFTTTSIPYPSGLGMSYPQTAQVEYDAQRTALFVLLPAGGGSTSPTLLRYAFDGAAWGAPTQISMAGLIKIHLSADGTHLLALAAPDGTHTSIAELDPVTLAQTDITTVANPYTVGSACGFALANDGNAIVGYSDSYGLVYGTFSRVFTPLANDDGGCDPAASGNGAVVGMTLSTFLASSETVVNGGPETDSGTTADFAGDRFTTSGQAYDQTGQSLGYLNGIYGQIINSAGTRAYGVTPDPTTYVPTLVTFDLTAASGNVFAQVGTPITLPGCVEGSCPEAFYTLATTPDGATLFIAAPNYVIVQPISP